MEVWIYFSFLEFWPGSEIGKRTRGVKIIMQEGEKGPSASEFYEDRVVIRTSR
jgi:hypothetical protein